jgi:predicted transposase/invertase (TIGR01784 family)
MNKNEIENLIIDYSRLMDLRVDFAFKTFIEGNPEALISLLNAIFANAKINRVVKNAIIKNPNLDKKSTKDKLSILDVRAELDDGTDILIEMHLHGIGHLLAKMIRSWARAFSEELEAGENYTSQPPTVAIAFSNGAIEPIEKPKNDKSKIHTICMITDKDDGTIITNALEIHFIDMKAFAKAVNEANSIDIKETHEDMFAYWLSVITEKEIVNKDIIENARKKKEVIQMAVSAIAKQSEDKRIRQAYERRKDEVYFYNLERAEDRRVMEQQAEEIARLQSVATENETLRREIETLRAGKTT